MKALNLAGLTIAAWCFLCAVGYAQQSPPARINEATMARASDDMTKAPIDRIRSYKIYSDIFTCCVDVADVFEPALVKSVWYYEEEDGRAFIDSTVIRVAQNSWVAFTLQHGGAGWPYGNYLIDVYLDGTLTESVPFTVLPTYGGSEISEVVLSEETNESGYPVRPAVEFQPTIEPVYACVHLFNPPQKRTVVARWYQLIEGEDDYRIAEAAVEHDDTGWLMFSLTPASPLPSGGYYVEILVDGAPERKVPFSVK